MRRHHLLPLLVLLLSLPAQAADYFVRASGSNSNPGTSPAQAWATVSHAAQRVRAGDRVFVGAGVYSASIDPSASGQPGDPIIFLADRDGSRTGDAGSVTVYDANIDEDYIELEGFTVLGEFAWSRGRGGVIRSCVFENVNTAIRVRNNAELSVDSTTIRGARGHGVTVENGTLAMRDCIIEDVVGRGVRVNNSGSVLTMDRCRISDVQIGVYAENGTLTVRNTIIVNTTEDAIQGRNQANITVVHCTIDRTGSDGFESSGTAFAYNNIFSNVGASGMHRAGGSFTASNNVVFNRGRDMSQNFNSPSEFMLDPMYTDVSAGDYTLQPDSPVRDIGMDASAFTAQDHLGNPRPFGVGWDMGAYEWSGLSKTIYVRTNGSDTNSGRTPGRAYRTIQKAISEATAEGYTIHVGPGTYAQALQIGTGAGAAAVSGTADEPNRLIADTSGSDTGDSPGPVIISGNNRSIGIGVLVSGRSHWHIEGFRFTGHGSTAVQASGGISLINCVIDVPRQYGVYTTGSASSAVLGCTFNFDSASGHTVVMQLTNGGASTLRIEDNRMHNTGVNYLATGYRTVVPTSFNAANTWRYGIYAFGSNNPGGSVTIRNNIISDKYVGIFGTSNSSGPLIIANNTITGCSFPLYSVGSPAGSVVANNILSGNYYGLWGDGLIPIRALCEHAITFDMRRLSRRNLPSEIITTDPRLADPAESVFALFQGSDCIDAGVPDGASDEDIAGNPRPADGDGDGLRAYDLGAMEEVIPRERVRVVRWREVSPLEED